MESKIKHIADCCRCGYAIIVNNHKTYGIRLESYLKVATNTKMVVNANSFADIRETAINKDTIVEISLYLGSLTKEHVIMHYDLDMAINEAYEFVLSI